MRDGPIIALDLAVRTGVAVGPAGMPPRSFALTLKRPGQAQDVAFGNMVAWLVETFGKHKPALVFKEQMLPLAGFRRLGSGEDVVRMHAGLHAIVEAICVRHGVPWRERSHSTVRAHFIGKSSFGSRPAAKRAVLARCHQLGLLERDCWDDDQADAIACHDWASYHLMRRPLRVAA